MNPEKGRQLLSKCITWHQLLPEGVRLSNGTRTNRKLPSVVYKTHFTSEDTEGESLSNELRDECLEKDLGCVVLNLDTHNLELAET